MSFLNRAGRRSLKRFRKAPELSSLVTKHALVDEHVLDDFRRDAPIFNASLSEPFQIDGADFEPSADAKRDLFLTNFTATDPGVLDAEQVKPSRSLVREVIAQLQHNEHHLATRAMTRGDKTNSAVVTMREADELERALQEHEAQDATEKAEAAQQAEQEIEDLQAQLDALREQAKALSDQGFPLPEHLPAEIKDLTAQREQAAGQLADVAATQGAGMPQTAVAIAEQAAEQGQKIGQVWRALPGNEPGKRCRIAPDAAIKIANFWMDSPDLQEMAILIGRMNRNFRAAVARSRKGGNEKITGITHGNYLPNVLPSERMQLGHPLLRNMFLRGFVDEQLLQFEMAGEEHVQQGPGIFLVDLSTSMRGARFRFAMAAAIAFVRTMHRDGRHAMVIFYNRTADTVYEFDHRRPIDLEVITTMASEGVRGGTDITQAMLRAEEILNRVPEFERADIVLLTDGEDQFRSDDEAVRERLKERGVRIHGVLVHGATTTDYTRQMCDHEISIADLTAPSDATTTLAQAVSA